MNPYSLTGKERFNTGILLVFQLKEIIDRLTKEEREFVLSINSFQGFTYDQVALLSELKDKYTE